jgi:hAT family C-terminal dimerisation region
VASFIRKVPSGPLPDLVQYDVWASLARDMLPIMVSSVSSKRAFSSAGITISKRCNRLKPDIIEVLQFLKCIYHRELLFQEEPSTVLEVEEYDDLQGADDGNLHNAEQVGWDGLINNLADDEGFVDCDEDDVFVQDVF